MLGVTKKALGEGFNKSGECFAVALLRKPRKEGRPKRKRRLVPALISGRFQSTNQSLLETFFTAVAVLLRILSNPLGNVFQKQLTAKGHAPLLVNFRTYLALSLVCVVIAVQVPWRSLPPAFWLYSVLGGMTGALGNGLLVKALQKGELSVLGPINAYKSIVGMLVGIFLLGEIPGLWGLLGVALIVCGSYFVLGATEEKFSWALLRRSEIQLRLWALVFSAIEAVFIKKIILASSVATAFLSWCWFGAAFSFVLVLFYRAKSEGENKKPGPPQYKKYFFLICCIGTMQATTNYAFARMPVGYALALFQLSTLVSVLLGHRIFNEQEIQKKLIGAAVMVAGSVVIILVK